MPRIEVRRSGLFFVAFEVKDDGGEHNHRRGITAGHAISRVVRGLSS